MQNMAGNIPCVKYFSLIKQGGAIFYSLFLHHNICGKYSYVASHGYAGGSQWSVAQPVEPVEQDTGLHDNAGSHHKQVRHIVQAWTPGTNITSVHVGLGKGILHQHIKFILIFQLKSTLL